MFPSKDTFDCDSGDCSTGSSASEIMGCIMSIFYSSSKCFFLLCTHGNNRTRVIILHSVKKFNTAKQTHTLQEFCQKKAEIRSRNGGKGKEVFVTGQSDERWHANHLNAKAERIDWD